MSDGSGLVRLLIGLHAGNLLHRASELQPKGEQAQGKRLRHIAYTVLTGESLQVAKILSAGTTKDLVHYFDWGHPGELMSGCVKGGYRDLICPRRNIPKVQHQADRHYGIPQLAFIVQPHDT
jgi:hypothetical protein